MERNINIKSSKLICLRTLYVNDAENETSRLRTKCRPKYKCKLVKTNLFNNKIT